MASGVSIVEGTARAGAMIFVGISAYYGSFGCGISGCFGPTRTSGYAT